MPRCRLWRYRGGAGGDRMSLPGSDRRAWRPCRERVPSGAHGCDECHRELLACPNPAVRLELARDDRTPDDVLELLTTDGDASVSSAARHRLGAWFAPAPIDTDTDEDQQ